MASINLTEDETKMSEFIKESLKLDIKNKDDCDRFKHFIYIKTTIDAHQNYKDFIDSLNKSKAFAEYTNKYFPELEPVENKSFKVIKLESVKSKYKIYVANMKNVFGLDVTKEYICNSLLIHLQVLSQSTEAVAFLDFINQSIINLIEYTYAYFPKK